MDLVVNIYDLTKTFPSEEIYGLTRQLRRSAVSIPSNIAEGCSRSSHKDFRHFLEMSQGSSFESETQLVLSNRLDFVTIEKLNPVLNDLHHLQSRINLFMQRTKEF